MGEAKKAAALSYEEWKEQGRSIFGANPFFWKFVCPSCGNVQSGADFEELGCDMDELDKVYRDCIGRHDGKHMHVHMGTKPGPCNYTSFGMLNINPVTVIHPDSEHPVKVFAFAEVGDSKET